MSLCRGLVGLLSESVCLVQGSRSDAYVLSVGSRASVKLVRQCDVSVRLIALLFTSVSVMGIS